MEDLIMDLDEYNSILNLAKQVRVKVIIKISADGAINVPSELLEKNRRWLDIDTNVLFRNIYSKVLDTFESWFR